MKLFETIVLGCIVFFMGAFLVYGLIEQYPQQVLAFPFTVSALSALFALIRIVEIKLGRHPLQESESLKTVNEGDVSFINSYIFILMILPPLWLLGFELGIPLYILVFCLYFRIRWLTSLSVSLVSYAFIALVFNGILGARLPRGILLPMFV
ncbi:tripartite tricarboxylate transporter TctB family protein [Saccharospirillum sp.]|uniref:tripartite tricarboxylate transporter TctB family protein n=1 Tax=Saccharospirillum sp. TaxID=2033801 RepID=UPI0034A06F09